MEERKTAAVVLGILALAVITFTVIIPYIDLKKTQTLQFKSCTVHFKYDQHYASNYDVYRAAQNKLALCLCKAYQHADTATANEIVKIYRETGTAAGIDSVYNTRHNNVDTILKYRRKAFDTLILVD